MNLAVKTGNVTTTIGCVMAIMTVTVEKMRQTVVSEPWTTVLVIVQRYDGPEVTTHKCYFWFIYNQQYLSTSWVVVVVAVDVFGWKHQ